MQFTISLAQMHIHTGQLERNMARAAEFAQAAADRSSAMLLLPELWPYGYDLPEARVFAQAAPQILAELRRLATLHGLCIGGSLLLMSGEEVYNTLAWVDPQQPLPVYYRKTHLFRLMDEDRWLAPGKSLQQVDTPWGVAGLAICYDLRFPELFRRYALEGASSFILPAEWPARRIEHWQVLLRARAIENQCFMFAANCVGGEFGGRSAVINPWGEVLVEGSPGSEALLTAQIDTAQLDQARSFMPVFRDRRPDLYERPPAARVPPEAPPRHTGQAEG